MTTVLVTRPQPDADALATLLREKHFDVLVDPLFTAEFSTLPPEQKNYQALLATSRNAIRALKTCGAVETFLASPLFAVGEETEAEARASGFTNIMNAEGFATSLGNLVVETCTPAKGALLYLAGKQRKSLLEDELAAQNFTVDIWQAYAMRPSTALSEQTLDALRKKSVDAVLFFSERASMHFLTLAQALDADSLKNPDYICLSAQVAAPLQKRGLSAFYPPSPGLHALIELLMRKNH